MTEGASVDLASGSATQTKVRIAAYALVSRNAAQITVRIDDQVVAMSLSQGKYIGFDPIASAVWDRLEAPMRVDALCAALVAAYEGDPATIRADVVELLAELVALDLLLVSHSGE